MATISFTVPDDVRERFDAVFEGRSKSAIVTWLLLRAIAVEERRLRQPVSLVERLGRVCDSDGQPANDWLAR